jgi:dihydrolipoamide dehydrogenase
LNYSGRYQAEQERGDGLCKLIFDRRRRTMVGAHLLGGPASELIFICGMFIDSQMTLEQMRRFVFPHPTVGEIIREGLFQSEM